MIQLHAADIDMLAWLCHNVRKGWKDSILGPTEEAREAARVATEIRQIELERAIEALMAQR